MPTLRSCAYRPATKPTIFRDSTHHSQSFLQLRSIKQTISVHTPFGSIWSHLQFLQFMPCILSALAEDQGQWCVDCFSPRPSVARTSGSALGSSCWLPGLPCLPACLLALHIGRFAMCFPDSKQIQNCLIHRFLCSFWFQRSKFGDSMPCSNTDAWPQALAWQPDKSGEAPTVPDWI